jgi:phage-related protein (TIGR01555 family)
LQILKDGVKSLLNSISNSRIASHSNTYASSKLSYAECNEIYKGGIGNKIVRTKVNTALKEGFIFSDPNKEQIFYKKVYKEFKQALFWQLVFGRGIVVIMEKNRSLSDPLIKADITSTNTFVRSFSGDMVTSSDVDLDLNSERYNKPNYYQVNGNSIHHSRVIDFMYVEPINREKASYAYGGISEFELIYEQIINDGIVQKSGASVLDRSSTPIYKIKDFKQSIIANKEKDVLQFYTALENARNNLGAIILDKEDDAEVLTQSLTGLADTDRVTLRRLAMVTGIPLSIWIGESSQGLNNTGKSELSSFYSMIKQLQDGYIKTPLDELCEKLLIGGIEFKSPDEVTRQEKAMLESTILDNANKLFNLGIEFNSYLKKNGFEVPEIEEDFKELEGDFDED